MSFWGLDFSRISGRQFAVVQLFTAVETLVLGEWLRILFPVLFAQISTSQQLAAAIFLFVGLDIEHLLAVLAGPQKAQD